MNFNNLIKYLESCSQDQLNDILDSRDKIEFEKEWNTAFKSVPDHELPNNKEIFNKISNATMQHEIASYISDDLRLINNFKQNGVKNEFICLLEQCYLSGTVPPGKSA
jgi:hypothetical protein